MTWPPDKDGTQILKELKDDWDAKKVPVIIISAYTGRLDHTARSKAVFPKPFDIDQLMASVRARRQPAQGLVQALMAANAPSLMVSTTGRERVRVLIADEQPLFRSKATSHPGGHRRPGGHG